MNDDGKLVLDDNLICELRKLASSGAKPTALIEVIGKRLAPNGSNYRVLTIIYFREAFCLSLKDATLVGAASAFPDGWDDDVALDAEIADLLRATEHLWKRT